MNDLLPVQATGLGWTWSMTDLLRENKMQDQEGSQFPLPMNVAPFAYALIGTCSASSLASVVGFAVQAFLSHNMELHF